MNQSNLRQKQLSFINVLLLLLLLLTSWLQNAIKASALIASIANRSFVSQNVAAQQLINAFKMSADI